VVKRLQVHIDGKNSRRTRRATGNLPVEYRRCQMDLDCLVSWVERQFESIREFCLDYIRRATRYDERHQRRSNLFSAVESSVAAPISSWQLIYPKGFRRIGAPFMRSTSAFGSSIAIVVQRPLAYPSSQGSGVQSQDIIYRVTECLGRSTTLRAECSGVLRGVGWDGVTRSGKPGRRKLEFSGFGSGFRVTRAP
jgi:hypothetical protein